MRLLSPGRPLPRAVVTFLALSVCACAPALSLDDRPPPCASGYPLCPTTGMCTKAESMAATCPASLTVRQGGRLVIPTPGTPEPIVDAQDLTFVPGTDASKPVVEIRAPDGVALGDRVVTIATAAEGVPPRQVTISVSAIGVGTGGRDDGPGTTTAPFLTFGHAVDVAGEGDTIALLSNYVESPAPEDASGQRALPARVTIVGLDQGAELSTRLYPTGDVIIENVTLKQPTLVLDRESAIIELTDLRMPSAEGVRSPAPRIQVGSGARGASLKVSGSLTSLFGYAAPTISVEANDAAVTISDRATVGDGEGNPPLSLRGDRQALQIQGASVINWMGMTSVLMRGDDARVVIAGTSVVEKDCFINGKVDIQGERHVISIAHARFTPGLGQGGITFTGAGTQLTVEDAEFSVMGIQQDGHGSHAVVRNSRFTGYIDAGYKLIQGRVDLGNKREVGGDSFNAAAPALPGDTERSPVALAVTAAPGADAAVTVRGTTFEDQFPPALTVTGQNYCAGFYRITGEGIPITFY